MKPKFGKKCIPGLFCIENFTLFVIIILFMIIIYMYISYNRRTNSNSNTPSIIIVNPSSSSGSSDILSNPYYPPLKNEMPIFSERVPINVKTRPSNEDYSQMGILTKSSNDGGENVILPLFGKRSDISRSKYQYYTMSNTGVVNTKLPIYKNNKSYTSEQGSDELYSGDSVFVDGYDSNFNIKVYETGLLRYLPSL